MLHRLFAVLYNPSNVVRHDWRAGDLVVWETVALQHGRPAVSGPGERTLRRVAMVDAQAGAQRAWTRVSLADAAAVRAAYAHTGGRRSIHGRASSSCDASRINRSSAP